MDEDGEKEASEASEAPTPKQRQRKAKGPSKMRQAQVPRGAKVVVLAEVRTVPCD